MRRRRTTTKFASPMVERLAWDIDIKPVQVDNQIVQGYQALCRNDNQEILSVTKKSYHPATNEKLMEVATKMSEMTGFKIEGYNTFDGGRKVFAYLKNVEPVVIAGFPQDSYMLLGNTFDKTRSFFVGNVGEVLRCKNQFGRISIKTNVRHNSRINVKLDDLIIYYQQFVNEQRKLNETFTSWNGIAVPKELKELFIDEVLEIDPEKVSPIKRHYKESLFDSVNAEIGAMGNTVYGLFNGLTHYTTHKLEAKEKVKGNVFGHAAKLNARGYAFLNDYVAELS
jgi:hypothetical protein